MEQPQNEFPLIDVLDSLLAASICCYAATVVTTAATQSSMPCLCLKAGLNSCVCPSEGPVVFLDAVFVMKVKVFLITSFSKFSDQLLLQKRFLRNKGIRKLFF